MSDRYNKGISVVAHCPDWAHQFESIATELGTLLAGIPVEGIEHVGSTSVPGLPAKPIIDIDVIVQRSAMTDATLALERGGYKHLGDLGVTDREAFGAPEDNPARNVYLCVVGTLHVRNHLAVRETLRARPDLRDRYGTVKQKLASEPDMNIHRYLAGKSAVLQEVLAHSDLTPREKREIYELNTRADPS
ncbi:GrpB family protein [Nesterenkonia haasae]|uniref:GrpB family protein n=1 Tax=Nesterenkonia haasae TaxID=2587813 RepID=UPI0013912784|nr:GrpB family protein [Nesterenkonia haasae]NDK31272.1 GrpB family protein [Nesterenkonia haasae]